MCRVVRTNMEQGGGCKNGYKLMHAAMQRSLLIPEHLLATPEVKRQYPGTQASLKDQA